MLSAHQVKSMASLLDLIAMEVFVFSAFVDERGKLNEDEQYTDVLLGLSDRSEAEVLLNVASTIHDRQRVVIFIPDVDAETNERTERFLAALDATTDRIKAICAGQGFRFVTESEFRQQMAKLDAGESPLYEVAPPTGEKAAAAENAPAGDAVSPAARAFLGKDFLERVGIVDGK